MVVLCSGWCAVLKQCVVLQQCTIVRGTVAVCSNGWRRGVRAAHKSRQPGETLCGIRGCEIRMLRFSSSIDLPQKGKAPFVSKL